MKEEIDKAGLFGAIYVVLGLILCAVAVGGLVHTDICMDRDYQGYYYLAQNAGSPEVVADFLEQYLDAVEDMHGYSGIVYKNPGTDVDYQKQVVQSFLDRANDLSEKKEFNQQSIDVQLSFQKLTDDMTDKQLQLVRWSLVNEHKMLGYSLFFLTMIWWWTAILGWMFWDALR